MKTAERLMHREQAPPGFWQWPGEETALVQGVEFESVTPTRFFQTVDAYPHSWGRLSWRVQVNMIVAGQCALPMFRTFYPGVEWNLNHADHHWFLTAWFRWDGRTGEQAQAHVGAPPQIEDDTAVFGIPCDPTLTTPLHLRSRIDTRTRRSIAEALQSQAEPTVTPTHGVILLDDVIDLANRNKAP
jgi:hypothetical protein